MSRGEKGPYCYCYDCLRKVHRRENLSEEDDCPVCGGDVHKDKHPGKPRKRRRARKATKEQQENRKARTQPEKTIADMKRDRQYHARMCGG